MPIVACVQLNASSDVEKNLRSTEALVERAVRAGAELVATPEATTFLGPHDRKVACFGRGDHLRDHRVVVHRHLAALGDAGVDAHTGQPRLAVQQQRTRLREKFLRGIFSVDARFDRVSALADAVLRPGQRIAPRDEQLSADHIDACHLFGDRMLDLQSRVHLEEVKRRVI